MKKHFVFDFPASGQELSFHDLLFLCWARVAEVKLNLEKSAPMEELIAKIGEEESQKLMLKISDLLNKESMVVDENGVSINFILEI
jgi:hypothetical protein